MRTVLPIFSTRYIISYTCSFKVLRSTLCTERSSTAAFINDNITVYGEVSGIDICPSAQVQDAELPRIDAKYIELE
ncbi:hypothetical protein DRQ25_17250 [Candidatus Fermentibacteria bacterium]|nr:MAG: hypothetical protein DRQ25_17250 [Candidatus Fermentibacteria bacterium]